MSAYNAEKYIAEAVKSILCQIFRDFEFIIINDGSTDNTSSIIKKIKDDRIVFIDDKTNLGLVSRLNHGFSIAKGEYIARMDADDLSFSERFQMQVSFMKLYPRTGLLGTAAWKINADSGEKLGEWDMPVSHKLCKRFLISGLNPFIHTSVMIRKSAIPDGVQYEEKHIYAEDFGLWCELSKYTRMANLKHPLIKYRWHENSISKLHEREQQISTDKARQNFVNYLRSKKRKN